MNTRPSHGMTALELLIYAAVLSVLTIAVIVTFVSLRTVFEKTRVERVVTNAGVTSIDRLVRDIRDADTVNTLLSTLDATSSVLVLENGATTTTYRVGGGVLTLEVEGVVKGALTPDTAQVTNFAAVRYGGVSSDMVRVTLDLAVVGPFASTTKRFSGAAVLRGSYEE
jgi:type II secretory pathway pseudopilin PulG